jgi:hypothetical protein
VRILRILWKVIRHPYEAWLHLRISYLQAVNDSLRKQLTPEQKEEFKRRMAEKGFKQEDT